MRFNLFAFVSAAVVFIPALEPRTDLPFYFFHLPAGILFGHLAFADCATEVLPDFPKVRFGLLAFISAAVVFVPALEPGTDAPFYFFHLPAGVLFGYLAFADCAMEMLPYFPEVRFGFLAFVFTAVVFVPALESGEGLSLYFTHLPSGIFLRYLAFFDRVLELGPYFPEARMDFFLLVLPARVFFTGLGVFRDRLPLGAGVLFAQLPACYRRLQPLAELLDIRLVCIAVFLVAAALVFSGRLLERAHHHVGLLFADFALLDGRLETLPNRVVILGGCDAKGKHDHCAKQHECLEATRFRPAWIF